MNALRWQAICKRLCHCVTLTCCLVVCHSLLGVTLRCYFVGVTLGCFFLLSSQMELLLWHLACAAVFPQYVWHPAHAQAQIYKVYKYTKPRLCLPSFACPAMSEPLPKKPKVGGQRQRLQNFAAATGSAPASSSLAIFLEEQWAWGYFSPPTCQRIALLAVADMHSMGLQEAPTALQKLASLGSAGAHSQNCHRDMASLVKGKSCLPSPLQEKFNMKNGLYLQSIMLPHEMLSALWHHYKDYCS